MGIQSLLKAAAVKALEEDLRKEILFVVTFME